tara:strand:+ start:207 stop:3809 length:3603 start_codon:yes stop_codon:yes gene_type:complete
MPEVKNAFIKSKMNKDLDARLLPSGEYRNALNVQISKSEGSDVGALENILGNKWLKAFANETSNLYCIGHFVDESREAIYLFFTDNTETAYNSSSNNYIFSFQPSATENIKTLLVEGSFLNFSTKSPIYGINLLEDLLFFTDNRNQPRKINIDDAAGGTYYTTEDQISVAKVAPVYSMLVYKENSNSSATVPYETTMKDVVSLFLPHGGTADVNASVTGSNTFSIGNLNINKYPNEPRVGATIAKVNTNGTITDLNVTVLSYSSPTITLQVGEAVDLSNNTQVVFDFNPYFDNTYAGDSKFLENKFVKFSYRFKYDDGEYSTLAPFTQSCFIPKQDGYFLNNAIDQGDQIESFESTIVSFMENKVNSIDFIIPLPGAANQINSKFLIEEIDIIYKESDGTALYAIESISVPNEIASAGSSEYYTYTYINKKPYKTLPEADLIRVYDKTPVKALAQEVSGNRIIYGNFQDKHTPPDFMDYNVGIASKFNFNATGTNFNVEDKTSIVEYPNSTLKTNRTYQVGIVLADKFGRQSSVILSNSTTKVTFAGNTFEGETIYSPYIDEQIDQSEWPGNSIRLLINSLPASGADSNTMYPGIYNGDINDPAYNPLGWYSYKIVVKQTEQEYYNIYTAGALKGNANINTSLIDGEESHISLINDNINKLPRDLSEVGPQDKTFRSSVRLYGRVNNKDTDTSTYPNGSYAYSNTGNTQFYPGAFSFTAKNIQDIFDVYNYNTTTSGDIPDTEKINLFYEATRNPLVAAISTSQTSSLQFGQQSPITGANFTTIKNLAVFETEPVVSLLDIYWETSTSGLLSDLQTAIDNSGGNATATFSSFNDSVFNETLNNGDDILAGDFSINDSFGSAIPNSDITSFTVVHVRTTEQTPQDVTNNFELYQSTAGDYSTNNIRTKNNFQVNNYYGSDDGKRIFNFRFSVTTDDGTGNPSTTTIINKSASLLNVPPVIYKNDGTTLQPPTENLGALPRATTTLKQLKGKNGATSNSDFEGRNLAWSVSAVDSNGNTASNYFSASAIPGQDISSCTVANTSPGTIPVGTYTITVTLTDAGSSTDSTVLTVFLGAVPTSIVEAVYRFIFQGGGGAGFNDQTGVLIEITGRTNASENGFYIIFGSWLTLQNSADSSNNIEIDRTNAKFIGTNGCAGGPWYYDNDKADIPTLIKNCASVTPNSVSGPISETTITTTGFTFSIV